MTGRRHRRRTISCLAVLLWVGVSCAGRPSDGSQKLSRNSGKTPHLATAHGVAIYVNPLNCKLASEDIDALLAIDSIAGVSTAIVWTIPPGNDSGVVQPLRDALRLGSQERSSVRQEIRTLSATSGQQVPEVVVVKSRKIRATFHGDIGWSLRMARLTLTTQS